MNIFIIIIIGFAVWTCILCVTLTFMAIGKEADREMERKKTRGIIKDIAEELEKGNYD